MSSSRARFRLVVFDMDGTVFQSHYNWKEIKKDLGIKENILKEIALPGRRCAPRMKRLEEYEYRNSRKTLPNPGIHSLLDALKNRGIMTALNTNNNRENTRYLLEKFQLSFDRVITREHCLWKPDPDSFLHLSRECRCDPREIASVGDSRYDILASRAAGIEAIYIIMGSGSEILAAEYPFVTLFRDFDQLRKMLI